MASLVRMFDMLTPNELAIVSNAAEDFDEVSGANVTVVLYQRGSGKIQMQLRTKVMHAVMARLRLLSLMIL